MRKLVSIITPCYNGERYLAKYFESLLAQTYPDIELFFVNDGSTDKTEMIALAYGEKLKAKGYGFTYIYQENAGQSAAINQGLTLFKGDYLNWMDSDDYLPRNSIENRVKCLEDNPKAGLVIGKTILVDDIHFRQIGVLEEMRFSNGSSREMIEEYLKGTFVNPCCSTMVRSSMFKHAMNGHLQIEEVREIGQNYQLFIPMLFSYPVVYISTVLSYCVIHKDSHSHSRKSFEEKIRILDVTDATLNSISDRIPIDEKDRIWFKAKITEYDNKNRLDVLQHYHRKDGLEEIIRNLRQLGCYDASARKMVLKIKYPFVKRIADRLWQKKNG